ncbi:Glucoamylase (glucan-1,4-alpha-glucosidase), GH15 family [Nocardioides scoriae]|uniref:Glucoamylase (Glucan-1,4-alpha-glucosidase), GH15 family n=1 Tax=Nocardioides scoriae TaxID=642780 RepID=A0A1H1XP45_9ACTN|nr:glycoside hydrolase family 15 protein [Nocardioides scoriae]SDT10516.1 Glucoamylase (glucan-1,4-alpha-glucosidase), GH15 family [Nocardioides scoriae]
MAEPDEPSQEEAPGFLPIAQHGLIGDLRTCALVGSEGTIDWFCATRFDSPSVFGSLLDPGRGGSWRLGPSVPDARTSQFYFPDSTILVTRFMTERGVAEVHDFMPVLRAGDPDHRQRIVRRVTAVRGSTELTMSLAARPDYGRVHPETEATEHGVLITGGDLRLGLTASVPLDLVDGEVSAELRLDQGQEALFVLEVLAPDQPVASADEVDSDDLFARTAAFWRGWIARSTYTGRWRETVNRSALTLKLLTHEPSGAIIASPTTSLPESIGGERNWDYRYVWIRDAAFSLYALLRLGFTEEAAAFMRWLSERMAHPPEDGGSSEDLGPLRVLYDIDGHVPHESELEHLRGYRDSRPVRIGNGAVDQLQLDIYGELIDSVYLFNKYGEGISADAWSDLTRALEWLMDHWSRPDAGMWEVRDDPRHHTTSLLMSWVAIERMMRTARQRGLPGELARWADVRDEIYQRIMTEHWDDEVGAFMQARGSDTLDAGVLLMPMVKFVAPNDPRFVSTLAAVEERLVSDSLVFRYDVEASPDGLDGTEGTFSLCSFWYVEALTRVGRLEDARLALEKMFTYANHLGLYAEQIGLAGEQLGNFPQAFTHLSLISAALNLDRELG